MEPTEGTLSPRPAEAAPVAWGALIVQNGRLSGTRRCLLTPLILIGQAEGCDVRLNAQGIGPVQCALVVTASGILLRDLHGKATTLNNKVVSVATVRDGDQLAVGPFRFRIELTAPAALPQTKHQKPVDAECAERAREGLRVQAAAVAAQQVALGEEELRLQQRRAALEQQEAQLAGHLEDKRQKLIELRQQTRDAQEQLKQERGAHAAQLAEASKYLDAMRVEIADGKEQTLTERRRLFRLRQRLKQRLHRHWLAERQVMRRREEELAARCRALEQEGERLQHERDELSRARLRFNSDAEIGKRQLQDSWNQFRAEQRHWEASRAAEQDVLKERTSGLNQRELELLDAERDLAEEKQRWEQTRLYLEKETEGLESRVRNQRRKLNDLEQEVQRLEAAPRRQKESPAAHFQDVSQASNCQAIELRERQVREAEVDVQRRLTTLEKLAGELADQRLYLVEQCARLQQARRRWQQERDAAWAALEPLAQRLHEREQALVERGQNVAALEADNRQRQDEIAHLRKHLDAWQARLALRVTAWEGERDRLLAELRSREELAERQLVAVASLKQQWQQRRHQEVEQLQTWLATCERLGHESAKLRDDWLRRSAAMEQERRSLAERSTALEEYRQRCLARSPELKEAQEQLEHCRQSWAAEFVEASRPLVRDCAELDAQARRLEARMEQQRAELARAATAESERSLQVTERDHVQLVAETQYMKLRQQLQGLHDQTEIYERQIGELNEEVERLARALLDEALPATIPLAKAA